MALKEIRVEYGRTVNLGNYESERVAVGLAEDLGPDDLDDPGAAGRLAHHLLDQARDIAVARLRGYDTERRLERERRSRRLDDPSEAEAEGPPEEDER